MVKRAALLFAPMLLGGCAMADTQSTDVAVEPLAILSSWTVPSRDIRVGGEFILQVRIAPLKNLPDATVEIEIPEGAFTVGGNLRLLLGTVAPAPPPPPSKSPTPPALGMTLVRSFAVMPNRAGVYEIKVILRSDGGKQSVVNRIEVAPKI